MKKCKDYNIFEVFEGMCPYCRNFIQIEYFEGYVDDNGNMTEDCPMCKKEFIIEEFEKF